MGMVAQLTSPMIPVRDRHIEEISFEQFCLADNNGDWETRTALPGMTILQYPRAIIICTCGCGCAMIRQDGTDMTPYFEEDVILEVA